MPAKTTKKPEITKAESEQAAQALEALFASKFVSKRALYKENFLRGIMFGSGTIIGTAIVLTLILWILSGLSNVPFIEPIVENVQRTLESN